MSGKKLKIIVLTHGGAERLLELLSKVEEVEIAGVFVETKTQKQRGFKEKLKRSVKYDGYIETLRKFVSKMIGGKTDGAEELENILTGQDALKEKAESLKIPFFKVDNYHTEETKDFLRKTEADLGILYGTNIIKESVFSIPEKGSINIHLGLTPYYRGGPSVFWELFNGEKENGATVHYVAKKVDTGDVILQKTFPLEYDFEKYDLDYESFLSDYRASLKEPMAEMIVEAVSQIAEGREQKIEQDLSLGKRYRLPVKSEKDAMLRVLKKRQKAKGKR